MHWNTLKLNKSLIVNTDEILQVHPQITVKVYHIINVWQDGPNLANITSTVEMVDYTLESFMGEPLRMIESDGGTKYQMYQRYFQLYLAQHQNQSNIHYHTYS